MSQQIPAFSNATYRTISPWGVSMSNKSRHTGDTAFDKTCPHRASKHLKLIPVRCVTTETQASLSDLETDKNGTVERFVRDSLLRTRAGRLD